MMGCLIVAPPLLGMFITNERRLDQRHAIPLLPLRLFRSRRFSRGVATVLILNAAGTGAALLFCLTYYLQTGLGLAPLQAGLLFAPLGLGFAVGSAAAPRLFLRYGRRVLVAGVTLVIGGLGSIVVTDAAIAASNRPAAFVPVLLLSGIGQGLTNNPLITLVMSGVDQRDAGVASGVYLTTGELGNALGLALFGSIFLVLLTGDVTGADPVAFSRALRWTVSLLAIAMTCALPSVQRIRPEPNCP
jgi:MFS family permease